MWNSWIILITLISYSLLITACKIKIKMRSKTNHPFRMQVLVPAIKMKTERMIFNKMNDVRTVTVRGEHCNRKHWIIKTWERKGNKWIPAKESKAKIEGIGSFGITVNDDMIPRMDNAFAILCTEGNCAR
uniref:Novel immunogenic protein NIP-3 n=1 Tax=Onchocerca volvulus TaxID=6282 RepID=Q9NJD7_ONCVO|nr:novel immunogenic protein NIP-3 [Onchocerca volvulus]